MRPAFLGHKNGREPFPPVFLFFDRFRFFISMLRFALDFRDGRNVVFGGLVVGFGAFHALFRHAHHLKTRFPGTGPFIRVHYRERQMSVWPERSASQWILIGTLRIPIKTAVRRPHSRAAKTLLDHNTLQAGEKNGFDFSFFC